MDFNPDDHRAQCEHYLSRALGGRVCLVRAEVLTKSTRDAPWRLDVELDGIPRSYVLRFDPQRGEHEVEVLRAMEALPIPTPRVYGWDPQGETLGVGCFLSDFVAGESLLGPMLAGESWAEELYIDTVCALQEITREQISAIAHRLGDGQTAADVLEVAHDFFRANPDPLAEAVVSCLRATMPPLPEVRFSNGDLWLDNMIVRDRRLVGVIDFEGAGFSDPLYEFLLPFFVSPELRGRGVEERYCRRMGLDVGMLPWYHGLEYLDTWHWVVLTGEAFVHYTAESLRTTLAQWLEGGLE